jgi:hypothetical protein
MSNVYRDALGGNENTVKIKIFTYIMGTCYCARQDNWVQALAHGESRVINLTLP